MNGNLPTWIERLLGIESGPGEGTVWSLDHSWGWPPWLTLLFGMFAIAWVVAIYLRESRRTGVAFRLVLAGIRLALVGIVLLMLAQFALLLHRTGLPYVVVIVDDSASMSTPDQYGAKAAEKLRRRLREAGLDEDRISRLDLAKLILVERDGEILERIERDYKLRVYFLEDSPAGARAADDDREALLAEIKARRPDRQSTRLGSAVRTVLGDLRGTVPAAIILLTDGVNTEGPPLEKAAARARRMGVPLMVVALGDERPVRNLKLADLRVEEVVFVDDVVNFQVTLIGNGFEGRTVAVTLHEDGKSEVLARVDAVVGPDDQPRPLRLSYRPTAEGDFRYVVEVESLEGELNPDDNQLARTVHVRKEQIHVLLAAGYPSYEFRFLNNVLARDKTIQLHTLLQDADPEYAEQDAAALAVFPVRRSELFHYDVIILADLNPALLSPAILRNLADFVSQPGKGGGLVLIAGPRRYVPAAYRGTPLAQFIPVELSSVRYPEPDRPLTEGMLVRPTELGLISPPMQLGDTPAESRRIWEKLPPLYWMVEAPVPKPAARVLAEHPTRTGRDGGKLPIILMQYGPPGKVLFHATDETWRWRWRVGDVFYARYWIQTIRYLSRSKLAEGNDGVNLSVDPDECRWGESVRLRVAFADERRAPADDLGVTVVVEHRGHKTQRLQLHRGLIGRGVFEGLLTKPPIGEYRAWLAVPATEGRVPPVKFSVKAQQGEKQGLPTDTPTLRRVAERTKGHFYTLADAGDLLGDLPPGHQVPVESLPPRPLWNRWPLLLLFLGLLVTEWILRKWGGMV